MSAKPKPISQTQTGGDGGPENSPNTGRFPKGRSGNPKGRAPGSGKRTKSGSALEILLDKTVTVTIGGIAREISMEEAIQQRTFKDALAGKGMPMREVVKWVIKRDAWFRKHATAQLTQPKVTRHISEDPDNADAALVLLGIAAPNSARADLGGERAQLLLEPWAAQHGLNRKRRGASLTERERDEVRRCTRDPGTLIFPGDSPKRFTGEANETD